MELTTKTENQTFLKIKTLRKKKYQIKLSMSMIGFVNKEPRLTTLSLMKMQLHKFRLVLIPRMTQLAINSIKKPAQMQSDKKSKRIK